MSDRRWKRLERDVAKKLGGQRIPVTGVRADADVLTPLFACQVKSRARLPKWLPEWLSGVTYTAAMTGRTGILVLHTPGQELDDAVVCLRMRDWVELHGR